MALSKQATTVTGGNGFGDPMALLILVCTENSTEAVVATNGFFGISEAVATIVRIDSETAVNESWSASTNGKAAFSPTPVAFIKKLLAAHQLVIRLQSQYQVAVTATFDLAGLGDVISKLQLACHWK